MAVAGLNSDFILQHACASTHSAIELIVYSSEASDVFAARSSLRDGILSHGDKRKAELHFRMHRRREI